jgi:hypothetical protein
MKQAKLKNDRLIWVTSGSTMLAADRPLTD